MSQRRDNGSGEEAYIEVLEFRPTREQRNLRLDRFVSSSLPDLSRTYLQSLIDQGLIQVDGQGRRAAFKMTPGQVVTVFLPEVENIEIEPEDIPLDIVYEDDDVLVVNKPAGMVVHPAPGHPGGTLVNAVLAHAPDIAIAGSTRPGLVHRLDKDTSGLIIVAKTDRAHTALVDQWQQRTVEKRYVALVAGVVDEDEATIDAPVGRDPANRQRMATARTGRDAVSHFTVSERFRDATLLDVRIDTGRTHQIRVHLAFIGHPVVGDGVYGNARSRELASRLGLRRQFLHASVLALRLPDGSERRFEAPLPDDLVDALGALDKERDT